MQSGYKTITPVQLANALSALASGNINHHALRIYFACFALVAIREAAGRSRCKRHQKPRELARYRLRELERLTGLSPRAIKRALCNLTESALVEYQEGEIAITTDPLPGSSDLLLELSGGRSPKRPIPVPRSMLRFLAHNRKSALTLTAIAYLVRGLSLSRTGKISAKGTVKASWIAETFGLSERAVRYARTELVRLGWIERDTGSYQRKLNRDGAYFSINLDWAFAQKASTSIRAAISSVDNLAKPFVNSDKGGSEFAPLPLEKCMVFAPPYKDRKTSIEVENQKTQSAEAPRSGFYLKGAGESPPAKDDLPAASLTNIRPEDFHRLSRLEALYFQAIERGWVKPCEASALNFIGAAVRAREVGRDSPRVFVSLVRRELWHHITQAQEDRARTALMRYRTEDYDRFRMPQMKIFATSLAA